MSSLPLVSIIIPTFNRVDYLSRALESVLQQSYAEVELIVVDDGSTDATVAMLEKYDSQITVIQQAHQGVSKARNIGIGSANGEWISFLDSDDTWLPEKLTRQMAALQASPQYRIAHADEIWIRAGVRVNPMKKYTKVGGWIFQDCLPLCLISPSSVVIHRSVLDDVGCFDERLPACEDYDLWLRVTASYPVLHLPQKLTIKYGGHDDQLSQQHWGMDRFRIQAMIKLLDRVVLSEENRQATSVMLKQKINVMLAGAAKRQQFKRVEYYEKLLNTYCE